MRKEASALGAYMSPGEKLLGHPGKNKAIKLFKLFVDENEMTRGSYVILETGVALEEALSRLLRGTATQEDVNLLKRGYGPTEEWTSIKNLSSGKGNVFDKSELLEHLEFIRSCNQVLRE